jgi:hypothetical protein
VIDLDIHHRASVLINYVANALYTGITDGYRWSKFTTGTQDFRRN